MKRTVIACSIFEDELNSVLQDPAYDVDVKWLHAGLHCDLELLEKSLVKILDEVKDTAEGPRLLIGDGCLPQMKDLAKSYQIPVLSYKNCVESLIGVDKLRELERDKTMVITPAWIRKVFIAPDGVRQILGWDNTDLKINFGRYDRFLVLDFGLSPLTDEETMEFFDAVEVPIETMEMDLDRFKNVISEFLA
ncbi:MAG: DUF1638 domain-containing protein [Deltaproteobacteria bacterium]|jgi:hypothetical protein|nr:DUF1638 domain-containing protein [Deltaproteobacteria bacterium]